MTPGRWPRLERVPADDAIREIGTNGFPVIQALLRSRDSQLKSNVIRFVNRNAYGWVHISDQNERHYQAIAACYALGPVARPLIPGITNVFQRMDPSAQSFTQQWLASMGSDAEAAVPTLIAAVKDKSNPFRAMIPSNLGQIAGRRGKEVSAVLDQLRSDSDPTMRHTAMAGLMTLVSTNLGPYRWRLQSDGSWKREL